MKNFKLKLAVTTAVLGLSLSASAHRAWIVPTATVLSGDDPWVTFDAAISNDIFHADYHAMGLDNVRIMAPNGSEAALENPHTGKYRSNFDLHLTQQGTYKVYAASTGLSARWETADGERRFYPGRGRSYTPEGYAAEVPEDAINLQVRQTSRRQETFVTAGIPSDEVFIPDNVGLEMVPLTHPNDLYAGETAEFQFLIDGEPAVGAALEILAGGMRYRNSQDEITAVTNDEGIAEITWPAAGMYWMEAVYQDDMANPPATTRQGAYVATFEVLPQ